MPVDQNIQRFYKIAQDRDFSRDFLFRVTQMQLQGVPALRDDDLVYVKTASLPGRSISNVEVPYMGLNFNVPGSVTYTNSDSYSLTFYLDAQSTLRSYFEQATRNLFDDQTSTGEYGTSGLENYIILEQLDKQLNTVPNGSYKLIGASIRDVGSIEYSIAGGKGETVDIEVTLAYHYYILT